MVVIVGGGGGGGSGGGVVPKLPLFGLVEFSHFSQSASVHKGYGSE